MDICSKIVLGETVFLAELYVWHAACLRLELEWVDSPIGLYLYIALYPHMPG